MKCPVCDGDGRIYGKMYNRCGDLVQRVGECNHCHGTGEIQEGDLWAGKLAMTEAIAKWTERGWVVFLGDRIFQELEFKPLYRMERVK